MRIKSVFAVLITLVALAVVAFSFYQWNPYIQIDGIKYGKYPDPSNFIISLFIGFLLILYARNEWNKAGEYKDKKEFDKKHIEYHEELTRQLKTIHKEYEEVKTLGNDVILKMTEQQFNLGAK